MTKTVVRILIMLFIALTFGCNEVTKPEYPVNLEIAGVWQGINISVFTRLPGIITYLSPYELDNTGFRTCRNALASK